MSSKFTNGWISYYDPCREEIPDIIANKIRLMSEDDRLLKSRSKSGKTITFKLETIDLMVYTTIEQKLKLFSIAVKHNIPPQDLLSTLTFLCEEIRVKEFGGHYRTYHISRNIVASRWNGIFNEDWILLEDGSFANLSLLPRNRPRQ